MVQPLDVVVAGTKPFALALFAPLAERAGARPRIAVDPAQALALCGATPGLLVVEYDPRWLPALQQLRQQAPGRKVVAALPRGQEAAALALAPLSVEAVPWDGEAAPVLAGLERVLGPVVAPPRSPSAPASVPGRPGRPPASPPGTAAAAPAPAGAPAAPLPPVLPRPPPPAPAQATAQARAAAPVAPAPVERAAGVTDLFDDLEAVPGPAPVDRPTPDRASSSLPAPAASVAPPPYTGPALAAPPPAWPAGLPSVDEAEGALVMKLRGRLGPEAPLATLAEQATAAMSDLERAVLGGAAQPFDTRPILRAAVMRFRVAAAIATAPAPPARVDGAAVAALLADLDAVLGEVNALASAVPAEQQAALASVRNALVREAVDFSEVAHHASLAPTEALAPRGARAPEPRVVSIQAAEPAAPHQTRRRVVLGVVLALASLAAAGYHAWRWNQKEQAITSLRTIPGAPDGMMLLPSAPGSPRVLVPVRKPDRAQVERFRADQARRGFTVTEDGAGVLTITRQDGGRPGDAGRTP
jgi:hypothetical protein